MFNWDTCFDIAGADYTFNDWTFAAESGWGKTQGRLLRHRVTRPTFVPSYALLSRASPTQRATLRVESFESGVIHKRAFTAAYFWTPLPKLRAGFELTKAGAEHRLLAELRYRFSR